MKKWYEVKRDSISVLFESSLGVRDLVMDILSPYYNINSIYEGEVLTKWKLRVSAENEPKKDNDFSIYIFNNKGDEEKVKYSINFDRKEVFIYGQQDEINLSQTLVRFIRSFTRNEVVKEGIIPMHGAMVSMNGKGICILGNKYAGKTTTTLLLLLGGADFISNDDVTFKFCNQNLTGQGWPRSMSLRKNIIPKLKPLKEDIEDIYQFNQHPYNRNSKINSTFAIRPQDLCKFFDVNLVVENDIHILIFPQFSEKEGCGIVELGPKEIRFEIFKNIEADFNRKFIGFNSYFAYPNLNLIFELVEYICSNIKCYKLYQDFNDLEKTPHYIYNILLKSFPEIGVEKR